MTARFHDWRRFSMALGGCFSALEVVPLLTDDVMDRIRHIVG